jgi:uncharacterized protein
VLILLPPSEGKAVPRRGKPLDPAALSFAALAPARARVLDALLALTESDHDGDRAAVALGLGATQTDLVDLDRRLRTSPAARAERIYTGVLYDHLGLASLSATARRRGASRLAITSSLFGLLRITDKIPSYRLAGGVSLPGVGPVAGVWRTALDPVVREALGSGLLVDLRSSTYAAFWRPAPDLAPRVATVRVLHEVDGRRQVVSHFNKATKGRLVRALLEDGRDARRPAALADLLRDLGWKVEQGEPTSAGTRLDVVVDTV